MHEVQTHDEGAGSDNVKTDAFQSAGLILHTRMLAELAGRYANQPEVTSIVIAVLIMAAAALEALLSEVAYNRNPSLYAQNNFRYAGTPKKYEMLMGHSSAEVEEIESYRRALAHAEPDNPRTRFVGEKINESGALWVANAIGKIAVDVWGTNMPNWFADTTRLSKSKRVGSENFGT